MASDKRKKRKRTDAPPDEADSPASQPVDTSKPTAIFKPGQGRDRTLSIALPGSIIANAQTHDQKTALAGSIARACAVFCVDEVVVFADGDERASGSSDSTRQQHSRADAESGYNAFADPCRFLAHLLSYLETPPHLRWTCFSLHPDLRTAGSLPSVDMPHHLKREEWCRWREGVVKAADGDKNATATTNDRSKKSKKLDSATESATSRVDTGLWNPVTIPVALEPGTRVTLRFDVDSPPKSDREPLTATAVRPDEPREQAGYYWGYAVRPAASLSAVFTDSPWPGGYDYCVGTSERGEPLERLVATELASGEEPHRHVLLVFGGVAGLERALAHDAPLQERGVKDPATLFDGYVNLVPGQGSRTIRTEEAVWCGLMGLQRLCGQSAAVT